jgi:hypothetical protein
LQSRGSLKARGVRKGTPKWGKCLISVLTSSAKETPGVTPEWIGQTTTVPLKDMIFSVQRRKTKVERGVGAEMIQEVGNVQETEWKIEHLSAIVPLIHIKTVLFAKTILLSPSCAKIE